MKKTLLKSGVIGLLMIACRQTNPATVDKNEFVQLMNRLAAAWTTQDTNAGLSCFTPDATYMQPPEEQFFQGHAQLRAYFGALKKGTVMRFHHLWFDENSQSGVGEFTFGNRSSQNAVTGVAVVNLQNGKIKSWREYFVKGPADFKQFVSPKNKKWRWSIENYP